MAPFRRLAFAGFGLCLLVHGATFFGIDLSEYVPGAWLPAAGVGVFVVFIAAGVAANRADPGPQAGDRDEDRLLAACPRRMRAALVVLFLYMPLNFIYTLELNEGGGPEVVDGRYVLQRKGKVIRRLTPWEYRWHRAYQTRGVSGHLMFFYFASAAALTAAKRLEAEKAKPNGDEAGAETP